jgi:excisionase family DNA binding protein
MSSAAPTDDVPAHLTTLEVARLLGMAVRSVQMMVDRGELEAWRTPGGHRRISRGSVTQWLVRRGVTPAQTPPAGPRNEAAGAAGHPAASRRHSVLLLEDSVHHQNLIRLLVQQRFPTVDLHVCGDGISGLAMFGRLEPDVLIVDILLPGVDGATLITTLRSQAQFDRTRLLVVTSLDPDQRGAYALALKGLPVVHKPVLVAELPGLLEECLASAEGRRPAETPPATGSA